MHADHGLLDIARRAAEAGADVLRRAEHGFFTVTTKSSAGDLVTSADVASERAIRDVLSTSRPFDSIVGEELPESVGSSGIRWVVDPLDGTTNFTRGLPFYAVSIGAQEETTGAWLVGVVAAPALDRSYLASTGGGARRLDTWGERQLPLPARPTSSRLVGTGFSYDPARRSAQAGDVGRLLRDFTDLRRFGAAALELCLVAEGALDAFDESDLAVHDWAAGALIAAESGARVRRPSASGGRLTAHRPDPAA